mgnify:CR=1 FL=1
MLDKNKKMKSFLESKGFKNIIPKYIENGSMRGCWRIVSRVNGKLGLTGYALYTSEVQEKLTNLGFRDFDGEPLNQYSGNGGVFAVFARFTGVSHA